METIPMLLILLFVLIIVFLVGYLIGVYKKGYMVEHTNQLPRELFKVVAIDRVSATLETITPKPVRVLVSTKVFGGAPVRPGQTVRSILSTKEHKERGLPNVDCPPLIVVETEEN